MIANGAVLVASISAVGAIWKEHVLTSILAWSISFCVTGFFAAAVAYVFAINFSVSLQKTRQEALRSGFHLEARRLWRGTTSCLWVVASFGLWSLFSLMAAGSFAVGALRKAAIG